MRSLPARQVPWKVLLVVMSLFCALPVQAQTQAPAQTKTKAKPKAKAKAKKKPSTKGKASEQAPAPESPPEQVKAPEPVPESAPEAAKAAASEPSKAPESAKAPAKTAEPAKAVAKKKEPAKAPPPAKAPEPEPEPEPVFAGGGAPSKLMIGLGLDFFTEDSRLTGSQAINASRTDESFAYSSARIWSATLSLSIPAPIASERARVGAGLRYLGNYGASREGQEVPYGFGLFNQVFVTGEYGLPVAPRMEALFGARGGISLLMPGKELSDEIDRLRDAGVSVWNVPRVGWLLGLSVGARRRMHEHILLRADLSGQAEQLYLFGTTQNVDGIRFEKDWSTFGLRLGLTLGVEFAI